MKNETGTHQTTEDEIAILSTLKVYKNKVPENAISSVCEQLSEVWTIKKVQDRWNYHKNINLLFFLM
jgi:hypothetical protein